MDFFRQLIEQLRTIWEPLTLQQRILMGVGFAAVLFGLFFLTIWQTTPEYGMLFANLQERDSGEVIEQLKSMNIPYKLSDDGTAILVPGNRVAETRLTLAQEGLPRGGGVGYEIFDRSRLGVTSFEQKVNLKRATEGELARTINQLSEVQWSRVQIVMAEDRLFSDQQQEQTASVFLNLLPGRKLKKRQIQAIQHLVANSVEGLDAENITILDQHANPLSMPEEPYLTATNLSASQFELRSRVEQHFHRKIQTMFNSIVGPDKSVVSVSVDLDFDSIERTEEKYDPDGSVVRSEQLEQESTTAPTSRSEGIAGVSANLPAVTPLATASIGASQKEASSTITNYEISKTIEHIIKSPSSIKDIAVSVVVDGTHKMVTGDDGKEVREYVPRTDDEIEKYKRMVLAAIGNPVLQNVEVINVPLESSAAAWQMADVVQTREKRGLYIAILKAGTTILALVFVFLLVRYVLKLALPSLATVTVEEGRVVGRPVEMGEEEVADTMDEVKDIADDRPQDAAALLKVWMREEE